MPKWPDQCDKGVIHNFDGDSEWWDTKYDTWGGTGEVSEEWLEERDRRRADEQRRWEDTKRRHAAPTSQKSESDPWNWIIGIIILLALLGKC